MLESAFDWQLCWALGIATSLWDFGSLRNLVAENRWSANLLIWMWLLTFRFGAEALGLTRITYGHYLQPMCIKGNSPCSRVSPSLTSLKAWTGEVKPSTATLLLHPARLDKLLDAQKSFIVSHVARGAVRPKTSLHEDGAAFGFRCFLFYQDGWHHREHRFWKPVLRLDSFLDPGKPHCVPSA